MEYSYAFLILLLPFLSFLVLGLLGMKMKKPLAGFIGTTVLGVLFAMSVYTAYEYFFVVGRDATTGLYPTVTVFNFTWLRFTELLTFNIGFRLTPISVMMLIVITTVSFMVHIYSFGYMVERDSKYKFEEYEHGFQRFYAYLSLFTMSMLGLVVATNIFQMYMFWELVGVCSYLLIGFYYPKHAAVHASKKAFIVTRFADLFFLIGILFFSFYWLFYFYYFFYRFVGFILQLIGNTKSLFFRSISRRKAEWINVCECYSIAHWVLVVRKGIPYGNKEFYIVLKPCFVCLVFAL